MKSTSQTSLEKLFLQGEEHVYKKHQLIYASEEPQNVIHCIKKGHIAVYSSKPPKNTRLLIVLQRKDIFPLLNLFIKDDHPGRCVALNDVTTYTIPKEQFEKALKEPQYAQDVLTKLAYLLSAFINRVDNLEMPKTYARLIGRIIFFAERYGTQRGKSTLINIPMTHAIIASSIAATRETVTRELAKLEKKGLIQYQNQKIVIEDVDKLHTELEKALL